MTLDINTTTKQKGFSLAETLVAITIILLIIGAIAALILAGFRMSRKEQEQNSITNESRKVLDRVTQEIRGAHNIDWNENGYIDDYYDKEHWLLLGDEYEMKFYFYDDRLDESIIVRYYLDTNSTLLKRQVTRLDYGSSGCVVTTEPPTVVASGIRNREQGKRIFCYLPDKGSLGDCCLRMPISLPAMVKRVRVTFIVDTDTEQAPSENIVETIITPQGGTITWPLDGSVPECRDCIDNDGDGQADHTGSNNSNNLKLPAEVVGCDNMNDPTETNESYECDDGEDNDGDGLVDFRADGRGDPQCLNTESPEEEGTACSDGIDNDGDGKIDFGSLPDNDPGCESEDDISELNHEVECDDGIDNDSDGRIDFGPNTHNDPGCESPLDNNERGDNACDDGIDNDGDGGIDYPGDTECDSVEDTSEHS